MHHSARQPNSRSQQSNREERNLMELQLEVRKNVLQLVCMLYMRRSSKTDVVKLRVRALGHVQTLGHGEGSDLLFEGLERFCGEIREGGTTVQHRPIPFLVLLLQNILDYKLTTSHRAYSAVKKSDRHGAACNRLKEQRNQQPDSKAFTDTVSRSNISTKVIHSTQETKQISCSGLAKRGGTRLTLKI